MSAGLSALLALALVAGPEPSPEPSPEPGPDSASPDTAPAQPSGQPNQIGPIAPVASPETGDAPSAEAPASPDSSVDTAATGSATAPAAAPSVPPPAVPEPATTGPAVPPPTAAPPPAAQEQPEPPDKEPAITYVKPKGPGELYEGGITWKFGSRKQNSVRMIMWHQIWNRYTEMNPGSQVSSENREHQYDVGLRRSRLLFVGNLTDRFQVLTHIGINNQTFNNARKPQVFVHEATAQVRAFKEYLYIGGGLHYWHGISRMTNASTLNFMSLDAPILNWPTIERSDQFARNLGVYAKGKIGLFDYRVAVNKPFVPGVTVAEDVEAPLAADYNPFNNSVQLAGYFMLQFLDRESNALPYAVGSYLGTKRVVNLGFGFQWHPDGMWSQDANGDTREHDVINIGADLFVDMPFRNENGAITGYGVYYYYDFGPDHLRNIGIMNVASGGTTTNGPGNAYPTIGSGHHGYAQIGYMLPQKWTGLQRLQPYFATQLSFFEALDEPSFVPEAGLNWHLLGHHFKLTAAYRNRPVFDAVEVGTETEQRVAARRSEVILQAHIFF